MAKIKMPSAPYGASNCSSTSGGSPAAAIGNPFAGIVPVLPILATAGALAAVAAVKAYDMVEGVVNQGLLGTMANKIRQEVTFDPASLRGVQNA
jgi:hypothetical protein